MEKRREKAEVVREKGLNKILGAVSALPELGKQRQQFTVITVFLCKILNPRLEGTVQVLNP